MLENCGYVCAVHDGDLTSHHLVNEHAFGRRAIDVLKKHFLRDLTSTENAEKIALIEKIAASEKAVLTSEIAFWAERPREILEFLKPGDKVYPIIVVRNQMEVMNNGVGELLSDFSISYEDAVETVLKAELDYAEIFYRWVDAFDNFRFIEYSSNILPDFAASIRASDAFETEIFENVSLSGTVSSFLYRVKNEVETAAEWTFVMEYFRMHPSSYLFPKSTLLPIELARDLYDRFNQENSKISGNLFNAKSIGDLRVDMSAPSREHDRRLMKMFHQARKLYERIGEKDSENVIG